LEHGRAKRSDKVTGSLADPRSSQDGTIWQQALRSSAVSSLALSARRRRCSPLKSIRVLPVAAARASLRTRTSSRR
jgi:hypothetical protein